MRISKGVLIFLATQGIVSFFAGLSFAQQCCPESPHYGSGCTSVGVKKDVPAGCQIMKWTCRGNPWPARPCYICMWDLSGWSCPPGCTDGDCASKPPPSPPQPPKITLTLVSCDAVASHGVISAADLNNLRSKFRSVYEEMKNKGLISSYVLPSVVQKDAEKVTRTHITEFYSALRSINSSLGSLSSWSNLASGKVEAEVVSGRPVKSSHIRSICQDLNAIITAYNNRP